MTNDQTPADVSYDPETSRSVNLLNIAESFRKEGRTGLAGILENSAHEITALNARIERLEIGLGRIEHVLSYEAKHADLVKMARKLLLETPAKARGGSSNEGE